VEALDYDFNLSKLERVMSGAGNVAALGHELERRGLKRTIVVTGKTLGGSALLEKVTGAAHLCHDKSTAQALMGADDTAAASAKNRAQISARCAEGGNNSHDEACQDRGAQGVDQDAPIQANPEGEIRMGVDRA
jgi:hypothetical protein